MDGFWNQPLADWLAGLGVLCALLLAALAWGVRHHRRSCRELTELRKTASELDAQLNQAQRMEAVGILSGGIVHNLNNLLAVILGHARMARREAAAESQQHEDMTQIIKAGTVASEMVQEISDFYRQADQARKPTDLVPLVHDTLKFLRDIVPPNIEIRENLDPKCGLVLATATGVQQVLMNLCSNSMQAMFRDQGVIEVTLRREKITEERRAFPHDLEPGTYVKLTVTDNGRGLSREAIDHILNSYFSKARWASGVGIGLSTVARILEDHDGVSIPQGRVGHGASFDIYFPLIAWTVESPGKAYKSAPRLRLLAGPAVQPLRRKRGPASRPPRSSRRAKRQRPRAACRRCRDRRARRSATSRTAAGCCWSTTRKWCCG